MKNKHKSEPLVSAYKMIAGFDRHNAKRIKDLSKEIDKLKQKRDEVQEKFDKLIK